MTLLNKNKTQAKVVDGKLILSCPDALTPVVWQMDLGGAKDSAFEVKPEGDQFALSSRKQDAQKVETIALFNKRDEAVHALMATSRALENAYGQINVVTAAHSTEAGPQAHHSVPLMHSAPPKKTNWGKVAAGIMGVIVVIVLIGMIQSMKPYAPNSAASARSQSAGGSAATSTEQGMPMSADEFLRQN